MASQLSILNPHPKKIPGPELLHQLVADNSQNDRPAIEYETSGGTIERLTYQQLHQRTDTLARRLRSTWNNAASSDNPRFIIPIFIQQCPHLYVSELAVLKAGGAFCPISLDIPEERLRDPATTRPNFPPEGFPGRGGRH